MTDESSESAARERSRVALITSRALARLTPDDQLLLAPLTEQGLLGVPAVWDDPRVDWDSYALCVLRSPWDYSARRDEFVAWAKMVPRLANTADVVAWNTDKWYLRELFRQGIPIVPTQWVTPSGRRWEPSIEIAELAGGNEVVIKPAVSASSRDTGRYDMSSAVHRDLAQQHVNRLVAADRVVMVQPYLVEVDRIGETTLIYLDGEFSHALRKGPLLTGPDIGPAGLGDSTLTPRTPTRAELELADQVLGVVASTGPSGGGDLLYARIDIVPGPDLTPLLMEFEVTEPSLYLSHAPGSERRFAEAIANRAVHVPGCEAAS